ncbi:MAG TPA: substrate-binding domain-containing protein [Anaerolineaceae bacterium]|nr:substrate-binding domain-containing protein [Anaerolineaceae bacterium]
MVNRAQAAPWWKKFIRTGAACLLFLAACASPTSSSPKSQPIQSQPSPPAATETPSTPSPAPAGLTLAVEPPLVHLAAELDSARAFEITVSQDVPQAVENGTALGLALLRLGMEQGSIQVWPAAFAPIALVVHPANPLDRLSLNQLKRILSGELTRWDEAGGANQAITLVLPGPDGGAVSTASSGILAGKRLAPARRVDVQQESDVIEVVKVNPGALGLARLSAVPTGAGLKLLEIDHAAPTSENAASGDYPLAARLVWLLPGKPASAARSLLDFTATPQGQAILQQAGWEPVSH